MNTISILSISLIIISNNIKIVMSDTYYLFKICNLNQLKNNFCIFGRYIKNFSDR